MNNDDVIGGGIGVTITKVSETPANGKVEIPSTVNECTVTRIGASAFYGCSSLTSIKLPDTVTTIGNGAFYGCSSLTSITLPASVTRIANNAFSGCTIENIILEGTSENPTYSFKNGMLLEKKEDDNFKLLKCTTGYDFTDGKLEIPANVTEIANSAFYGCPNLKEVKFAAGSEITEIPINAFYGCSSLTSIKLPDTVTTIWESAFEGCGLESITLPANVQTIGYEAFRDCPNLQEVIFNAKSTVQVIPFGAFRGCSSLTSIKLPETVTTIGESAFQGCGLESITLPDTVTTIRGSAFKGCSNLTSITLPANITKIEDRVFQGCSNLTSINIPESVKTIGYFAFEGCGLESITIPASVTSIGNNAFNGCPIENITLEGGETEDSPYKLQDGMLLEKKEDGNFKLLKCTTGYDFTDGKLEIPANVTGIADSAFYGCTKLKEVTFETGSTITVIPSNAFSGCSNLTSITLPDSVTSIGTSAFSGCSSLTSINIPDTVTTIGISAFEGCGLTSIKLPNGVTGIGASAFKNCKNLKNTDENGVLTIPASVTSIGAAAFNGCPIAAFEVAAGNGTYRANNGILMTVNQIVQYPERKPLNADGALTIPSGTTEIGSYAFANMSDIKKVVIPESVTKIGTNAFENCPNLETVEFEGDITTIPAYAFQGCGLESITIPASVRSLGSGVFMGCTGLTEVTFAEDSKITTVPSDAFNGCTGLTSITLPASVTDIGDGAFKGCTSLKKIAVATSENIGDSALVLPEGLKGIKASAFEGSGLTRIDIPPAVRNIGAYAFKDCKDLKYVKFSMDPTSVMDVTIYDTDVFAGATSLKAVYVTESFKNSLAFPLLGVNDKTYVIPTSAPAPLNNVTWEFKDGQINFTWKAPEHANGYTITRKGPGLSEEETIFDKLMSTNFNYASKVNSKGTYTFSITPHNYCNINPDSDDPFNREAQKGTPYEFTIESYAVNVTNNDQGKVTIDKDFALDGDTVTIKVTPNEHYILDTLIINGEVVENSKISKDGTYTFKMPGQDVNISSTYLGVTIPNTVNNGKVEVNKTGNDGEVQVVITPDENFDLESLVINGVLVPAERIKNNGDGTYTYTFIMNEGEEINILPTFKDKKSDITAPDTIDNEKFETDSQTDGAKGKDAQNNISNFIKTSGNELGSMMMLALLAVGSGYTIFKKKRYKDK